MKKLGYALGGILLVSGLGYVGLNYYAGRAATDLLAQLKANLPPNVTVQHGAVASTPWRPEVTISDLAITTTKAENKADSLTANKLVLRGWPIPGVKNIQISAITLEGLKTAGLATITADAISVETPSVSLVNYLMGGAAAITEGDFTFSGASATNLLIQSDMGSLTVPALKLGALEAGQLATVTMENPALVWTEGAAANASFAKVTAEALPIAGLINPNVPKWQALMATPNNKVLQVEGGVMQIQGMPASKIANGRIELAPTKTGGSMGLTFSGLDTDLPAGTSRFTEQLGYKQLSISGSTKLSYDLVARTATIYPFTLSLADMGKIDLKMDMDGMKVLGTDVKEMYETDINLKSLNLVYTDLGYTRKYYDIQAAAIEMSREEYIDQAVAPMAGMLGMVLGPKVQPLSAAVLDFLRNPTTLTITAEPATPISLRNFASSGGSPSEMISNLNLQIKVPEQAKE